MPTPPPAPDEVTRLLAAWGGGDRAALDRLMALVYDELHRIARRHMSRETPGHTLQTTALVNEAYLRLVGQRDARWENRAHFYAVAARMMRRVLVDYARRRRSGKRGGGAQAVPLEEAATLGADGAEGVIALDEALDALGGVDPRRVRVVELRYFGGLSVEETAAALSVSPNTVIRDWNLAKAWLRRKIQE